MKWRCSSRPVLREKKNIAHSTNFLIAGVFDGDITSEPGINEYCVKEFLNLHKAEYLKKFDIKESDFPAFRKTVCPVGK